MCSKYLRLTMLCLFQDMDTSEAGSGVSGPSDSAQPSSHSQAPQQVKLSTFVSFDHTHFRAIVDVDQWYCSLSL